MPDGGATYWRDGAWALPRPTEHIPQPNYHARIKRHVARFDVDRSGEFATDATPAQDVSVAPGEPATVAVLENDRARRRLATLIAEFHAHGYSLTADRSVSISEQSRDAAWAFIAALPRHAQLPKVVPDGEGGLLMLWERGGNRMLVSVDNWRLHCVEHAGTTRAVYHDDLPFERQQIPAAILTAVGAV